MGRARQIRLLGRFGAIGLMTVLSLAGAAAAVAEPSAAGLPGEYYLADSRASPGATCVFKDATYTSRLLRIRVVAPDVFARNLRDGRVDRQQVGWRYVIQRSADGLSWRTSARSSIRTAVATDSQPAEFAARNWPVSVVDYNLRVRIDIFWYRGGEVIARARASPRYYRYQPLGQVFEGGCRL